MPKKLQLNLPSLILIIISFLLPVFVLPMVSSPVANSKNLLFLAAALITLVSYLLISLKSKKWQLTLHPLIWPVLLFGLSILLSSLITHQYPSAQLMSWGGLFLAAMTIIVLAPSILSSKSSHHFLLALNLAGGVLALASILQLFGVGTGQLLNQLSVLEFNNDLSFSLAGGALVNIQLLSSLILANIVGKTYRKKPFWQINLAVLVIGLLVNIYAILPGQVANFQLLPLSASIAIVRQSLAVTRTALFGYGPASYAQAFNLLKPAWLNTTDYWQFAFDSATAFPLTLIVSGGLLALVTWLWWLVRSLQLVNTSSKNQTETALAMKWLIIATFIWQLLNPINIVSLAILTLTMSFYLASHRADYKKASFAFNRVFDPFKVRPENKVSNYTFTALSIVGLALVAILGYQVATNYAGLFANYQAMAAANANDINTAFAKQEQARNLARYNPTLRRNYAMMNLEIAIAMSNKTDITALEQEQVLTLVNTAITEAKAATILEPQDYQNWLALSNIYVQLLDVTEDATQQAFDALANTVTTNPNDPIMRMTLGQFFFGLEQWTDATTFFNQAIERKPDLTAAYYSLAQALVQDGQIIEAETALTQTLALLDKETNLEDYTQVEQELAEITTQADQLRAQAANQQAENSQAQLEQNNEQTELPATDQAMDMESSPSGQSNLGDLLNEQATEDMLLQENLATDSETVE